jgi:hypothetical protein
LGWRSTKLDANAEEALGAALRWRKEHHAQSASTPVNSTGFVAHKTFWLQFVKHGDPVTEDNCLILLPIQLRTCVIRHSLTHFQLWSDAAAPKPVQPLMLL